MKKIVSHLGEQHDTTKVLGIDPSSTAIAFTLVENGEPVVWGKLLFYRKSSLPDKMLMVSKFIPLILEITGTPSFVCLEQMVSIQNPHTTRVLSYMAGSMMHEFAIRGIPVGDVPPMTHKNYHGYIRVNKAMGLSKKEADRFKKQQIQDKIAVRWPNFNYADHDVADSCSIALWAAEISLKEVVGR